MLYTVYRVTNRLNGKIYVGKHQTLNPNDGYYGSGTAIRAALKKHGREFFDKEVLFVFETESEMNAKEKEIVTEEFISRHDTYNGGVGGEGGPHFRGRRHTEASKKKMQVGRKGGSLSIERRAQISATNRKRTLSAETREKLARAARGRVHNEETRQKIAESLRSRVISAGVTQR